MNTDEPVEFEEQQVEVQGLRKITECFRGIYRICLQSFDKLNTERWQHVT